MSSQRTAKRRLAGWLHRVPLEYLIDKDGGLCFYCAQPFESGERIQKVATEDAILPTTLLWEEVHIAHNDCHGFEQNWRKHKEYRARFEGDSPRIKVLVKQLTVEVK